MTGMGILGIVILAIANFIGGAAIVDAIRSNDPKAGLATFFAAFIVIPAAIGGAVLARSLGIHLIYFMIIPIYITVKFISSLGGYVGIR